MEFLKLPQLEVVDPARKEFRLLADWELVNPQTNEIIVIPKGFITDLASIPSVFFVWQWGKWNLAAIAHDWAYLNHFVLVKSGNRLEMVSLTRENSDRLFLDLMTELGVSFVVRTLMFFAVRRFGGRFWQ